MSGPGEGPQRRGKVALYGESTPPRGTLPIGAETSQELGRHGHAGEAKGRGVGQLVKEVTSWKDLGEDMEGFPGSSTESPGNEADVTIRARTSRPAYSPVMTTVLRRRHLTLVMDSRISQHSSITCKIVTHS